MSDVRKNLLTLAYEAEYDYTEPFYRAVEVIREARELAKWAVMQRDIPDEMYMASNFILHHTE